MTGDNVMSESTRDYCGNPAALAGYLYGECDPAERAAFEAHLAVCVSCAAELAALGATRSALASWTPPEVELGFQVTSPRDGSNVLRPARWWQRPMPAWAQAAAAVAIFAAGALLGTGIDRTAPREAAPAAAPQEFRAAPAAVTADDIARVEDRLRREIEALRVPGSDAAAVPASARAGDDETLQRIRRLLAESEERQQREFAMRLTQVLQEVESQRRLDLAMIERTFGQMEGVTRPELAEQRQMLNYLIRTAAQRPQ